MSAAPQTSAPENLTKHSTPTCLQEGISTRESAQTLELQHNSSHTMLEVCILQVSGVNCTRTIVLQVETEYGESGQYDS